MPRRLVHLVILMFGITLVTFFLLRLIPGDPALAILGSSYTHERAVAIDSTLGLDKPIWTQYGLFLGRLSHGNLGFSFFYGQSATTVIAHHIPPTVFLIAYSAVLAALISFPIGFVAGLRRGGIVDQSSRVFFTLSFAMPAFWLGIILILIFSVHVHAFPLSGFGRGFAGHVYYLFLPALTIALGFSTVLVRSLRAATISTLQAEFVDTARMKGIRWSQVLWKHVFRNAILAVVAVYGVNLAYLISGTVLVENVFSLPGLGTLLVNSVSTRDYPVVQGVTLLFAVLIVGINLITDITQAALDPRVGREIGSRILYGGRIDLAIAFGATSVTLVSGTIIGLVAGYLGGRVDAVLMRIVDLFFAFPFLVLIIAIIAMLGPSFFNVFVAIWITSWVAYARIMRAQTVVAKKQQYVLAARALGYGRLRVMFRHILPNTASAVIIFSMVDAIGNIILSASLGFLGLGAQPPTPEWGTMISDGQNYILTAWWLATLPGLAVVFVGVAFSLIGDGLADVLRTGDR